LWRIGVIIILIQTLPFFGIPAGSGPLASIEAWPRIVNEPNLGAAVVGALGLAVMVFWPSRLRAFIPPPLAALLIGTFAALIAFPDAPILGDIPTALPTLVIPTISLDRLPQIVQGAFVLAMLGSRPVHGSPTQPVRLSFKDVGVRVGSDLTGGLSNGPSSPHSNRQRCRK
jgi:sulfate permease, SulP family